MRTQAPGSSRRLSSLVAGFLEYARAAPDAPALCVAGQVLSYGTLLERAEQISAALVQANPEVPVAAVLARKSSDGYAAILGCLLAGKGYVPLNPTFPAERTRDMLTRSGTSLLIADPHSSTELERLLPELREPLQILLPGADSIPSGLAAALLRCSAAHRVVLRPLLEQARARWSGPILASGEAPAYVMFTSGSTGKPKGIVVSHDNVCSYVSSILEAYAPTTTARFTQFFDFTFDLSVHDLFVCWSAGAQLFAPDRAAALMPSRFVNAHGLTHWFSVPSMIRQLGLLPGKAAEMPSLRVSLFCGEALTESAARRFRQVAPNSTIDNLYGPTEATIAFTLHRHCLDGTAPDEVVPIGLALAGQRVAVMDPQGQPVPVGEKGELWLSGSQVTSGYLHAPDLTRERFVRDPTEPDRLWYRTGDIVAWRDDVGLRFYGRVDRQVKIRGYRVELPEVERAVRRAAATDSVAVVAWPRSDGSSYGGLVAFIGSGTWDADRVRAECAGVLPSYMVPDQIRCVADMPRNANGKIDYQVLSASLDC